MHTSTVLDNKMTDNMQLCLALYQNLSFKYSGIFRHLESETVLQMFILQMYNFNQFTIRKTTTNIMTLTIIYSFDWCCTHLVRFFIGIQSKKLVHRATWYSHSEQEGLCISSSEHGWKESVTWVIWERFLLSFYEAKRRFSACQLQCISFAQRADFNWR